MVRFLIKKYSFFAVICFLLSPLFATVNPIGKTFPQIELESLVGNTSLKLPGEKATLIVFCFEKECAEHARDWVQAIRNEKILPSKVSLYIVPVVGNSFRAKLLKPFIISSLKRRIPKAEHEKVALFVKDAMILKTFLGFEDHMKEHVFLTLINRHGRVVWQHAGTLNSATRFELKKMAEDVDRPRNFDE